MDTTILEENAPKRKLSSGAASSTKIIPREQHQALFSVINKARLLSGWTAREAGDLDSTIKAWAEIFDIYEIPHLVYEDLYRRAVDLRVNRINQGLDCPNITAELIASCWIGEHGLRAEIKQKEIEARNRLPETAQSQCARCFGVGIELVYGENGTRLGARPGCQHKKLEPGEWLFEKQKQDAEKAEKYKSFS